MLTHAALHPQLEADTVFVTDLPLSTVLLARDANYPWLILVPRPAGMVELIDLAPQDANQMMVEITICSHAMQTVSACHKLNVAALGNQVPQLHVHVIGRFKDDPAWPGPIWGVVPAIAYAPGELESRADQFRTAINQQSAD